MLLIFCLFLNCNSLTVYDDLGVSGYKNITNWNHIKLRKDHRVRQPIQPPSEWYNFTIKIPLNVSAIQFTAISPGDCSEPVSARIPYYKYKSYKLYVSLIWWCKPWVLYFGFL